jgi:hypothetical protein
VAKGRKLSAKKISFGGQLEIQQLVSLTAELQALRECPPLVRRSDGKYEGDILGFVKGLRLSARLIYFLRERLSDVNLDISWGHIVDDNEQSCSPECDIVIHKKGHIREWNGGNKHPIMEFKFVKASSVLAVVSCKSHLTSIDREYVASLKRCCVKNIFLFAECCKNMHLDKLQRNSKTAGYKGFWCLYTIDKDHSFISTDGVRLRDFGDAVYRSVK